MKRRIAIGILVATIFSILAFAAIENSAPQITPPPLKRVSAVVIYMGGSATLTTETVNGVATDKVVQEGLPYVEIVCAGTNYLKNGEGVIQKNAFGQNYYTDVPGWVGSKRITDPAKLQTWLPLWEQIMAGAEAEAAGIDVAKR